MVMGKLDNHMQKNEVGPLFYITHKTPLKWIRELKSSPETVKLPEGNKRKCFLIWPWQWFFLDMAKKAQATKQKSQVKLHQQKSSVHFHQQNKKET